MRVVTMQQANLSGKIDDTASNREKTLAYRRDWYARNAEKMRAKASEKVVCECGMEISRNNLSKHKKSDRHNQIMKNLFGKV